MGTINRDFKIVREGDYVLIPVLEIDGLSDLIVVEKALQKEETRETDYQKLVNIPENLREELPSSYDVIGDVAIVKIPDNLVQFKDEIGKSLVEANPRLRLVLSDGGVKGECRIRELHPIYGEGESGSIHVEFGVRMFIDPAVVYFNPRLSGERYRIAKAVQEGEIIIDMFAGAGPFPLVIKKHSNPQIIYAIDINPAAIEAMNKNIILNHSQGIIPILGDVREVIAVLPQANRVIMNLPQTALDFLPLAISKASSGATIHLYLISNRETWPNMLQEVMNVGQKENRKLEVIYEKELKTYSPRMSVYSLDLRLSL